MNHNENSMAGISSAQRSEINRLTGRCAGTKFPPAIGAIGSGAKFSPEGEVLPFPGNTFLCHIDPSSAAFHEIEEVQSGLRRGPAGDHFTYLPPSSFHMTVFPGICGDPLGYDGWPAGLATGTSLESLSGIFKERLSDKRCFRTASIVPANFSLGYCLQFSGATDEDTRNLWLARKVLEESTGIRRGDFLEYRFHVSIAYQTKWMTEDLALQHLERSERLFRRFCERVTEINLGQVEFCSFQNMHKFSLIEHISSR